MGFKIATNFTRTLASGAKDNLFLAWKKIIDLDIAVGGTIAFAVFENQAEYERGNQKDILFMPIGLSDIHSMFSRIGNVALEISDASWGIAKSSKFIEDYELDNDTNTYVRVLKSIDDLNGQIIDIGIQ